jgi:hypothetical protein
MTASPPPPTGGPSFLRRALSSVLARASGPRTKLARRATTLLGLLAPLAVLLVAHLWGSGPPLGFVSGTVRDPGQSARAITLPYRNELQPQGAKYDYELVFVAKDSPRSTLRIVPDDCVRSFSINGAPVPLRNFSAASLCDFRSGFDIDVGRFLHPGENHLSLQVENTSGPHGLAIYSVRDGDPWTVRSILLLLFAVLACSIPLRVLPLSFAERAIAAALLGLAGWIRYHFVFAWHPPESFIFSDMGGYVDRAVQLFQGRTDPNQTFQPLGYSMILALSLRLGGDLALAVWSHVVLGWASVGLVWRASARWLRSDVSLWVLAIAALHVPFITLSGFFLAETIFTFQLALLFYCLACFPFPWRVSHAFVLGVIYMSAVWIKGNNTLFGPLVVGWSALWVIAHPRWRAEWKVLARRLLPGVVAFSLGAALVVGSHAAYTYRHYGKAQLSASTSALNLVEGKCPSKNNRDTAGYAWESPLFVQLGENEEKLWPRPFTDQAYFFAAGIDCIRRDPAVLATSVRYIYYLFFDNQLWPPNGTRYAALVRWYGMFYSAILFPGILVGGLLIALRPRRRLMFIGLLGLSIVACSWIFKSELRYRVPFDVAFIPMSVIGWSWLIARLPLPARLRNAVLHKARPRAVFSITR